MEIRSPLFANPEDLNCPALSTKKLRTYLAEWLDDGEWKNHSVATRSIHWDVANNLLWFFGSPEIPKPLPNGTVQSIHRPRRDIAEPVEYVGKNELRSFLNYIKTGHSDPGGRWGNPQCTRPVRKGTLHLYFGRLRTFFRWMVKQEYINTSPMEKFDIPDNKRDQIMPFTDEQVNLLIKTARARQNARRDETILWLLYDTGIRASELCGLRRRDLDLTEKRITVLGKGGKRRSVYFGKYTAKALWTYLRNFEIEDDEPLFQSESGIKKGDPLNKDSLGLMFDRLEKASGIHGVRCSPHTMRHTFAISFLRAGGSAFALMEILGHTNLTMTNRYVALAEADLASQRRFSPADRLKRI